MHLFKTEILCNLINVFLFSFDQFNSFLKVLIAFQTKKHKRHRSSR